MSDPQKKKSKKKLLEEAREVLDQTDSTGLPESVASVKVFSVPLGYNLIMEVDDTLDGGDFRIPIDLGSGKPVIVTLTPKADQSILTIRVQTFTSTTRYD